MARPPADKPYVRSPKDLPKGGEWFVNTFELFWKVDEERNPNRCLSVMFAPVEHVIPHGKDHLVYFDQERIRMVESLFKINMMLTVKECATILRLLADDLERLAQ